MEVTNKEYTSELLKLKRGGDVMPPRSKKYFRPTKSGAGMTAAGVAKYRRDNPGSKLKTAVTGKVKPGSKAAKRRKSFCARSAGQMKKFPKAAKDPNSRLRQEMLEKIKQQILWVVRSVWNKIKSIWNKWVSWVFKGFYK
jgi:hypothetical protein